MRWYMIILALVVLYVAYTWYRDRFNPDDLSGKRVLITGASRGLGEELAFQYTKFGANVVITARNKDRLQKVLERCQTAGRKDRTYHSISADMSDRSAPESVVREATQVLGGLDVIVLNHAVFGNYEMWTGRDVNYADFDDAMTVNVRSFVHLASQALPHLEKSNGSVVVMSSVSAELPSPKLSPYSTSKAALNAFFTSWNFELKYRKSNVSVTLASLGLTDTESAHNTMRKILGFDSDSFGYVLPGDTVLAVIKATTLRQDHIYFPMSARVVVGLYDLAPSLYISLMTFMYGDLAE